MQIERIYIGGWFQRTTLHLSEVHDFLENAHSPLELDQNKLKELRDALRINSLEMKIAPLDYIAVTNDEEIKVKFFEDGLILLSKDSDSALEGDMQKLTSYYEGRLSPSISYLFSLGAPIPKELASIQNIYPYFIVLHNASQQEVDDIFSRLQEKKYFEIRRDEFQIHRGGKLYVINNLTEDLANIESFIEEQVFIREFKGQLHRYLNLHRIIWERIADVKERGSIRGSEIGPFKDKVESYSKTINLIDARMKQMGVYIRTRESIMKNNKNKIKFLDALDFKHETLADSLEYTKHLWAMTKNYVDSALALFTSIQAKSTESSVRNLTVVTSMGVGATLINLFSQKLPTIQMSGIIYFFILAFVGYSADKIMKKTYSRRMYKIRDIDIDKDIR